MDIVVPIVVMMLVVTLYYYVIVLMSKLAEWKNIKENPSITPLPDKRPEEPDNLKGRED